MAHIIAVSGLIIQIKDITKISRKPFRTEDGLFNQLETDDSASDPMYAITNEDGIQLIDLATAYNKASIMPGADYTTGDVIARLFINQWIESKQK